MKDLYLFLTVALLLSELRAFRQMLRNDLGEICVDNYFKTFAKRFSNFQNRQKCFLSYILTKTNILTPVSTEVISFAYNTKRSEQRSI